MKGCIFFLMFVIHIQFGYSQRRVDLTIQSENRKREAIISIPTTPPPSTGYPIVFMCHGTSGEATNFYQPVGWKDLGQKENFITVFPAALSWCYIDKDDSLKKHQTKFVCGDLLSQICDSDTSKLVDDIFFFRKIVQLVEDSLKINKSKIFMSGFSNGSSMAHKISMDGTDLFAASGGSSASLNPLDSTTPKKRIPMWYMVGTLDDRYFNDKFPTRLPFGGDSMLLYLQGSIRRALVCQGLTEKYTKTENGISKVYVWSECRPGEKCAPYVFMVNKDQTHQYPNGNNHPVDAPKILWQFFNNPPATTISTPLHAEISSNKNLTIFPNPAHHLVSINPNIIDKKWGLQILDLMGRVIFKRENLTHTNSVELNSWPQGSYLVKINYENSILSKFFIKD